jgi:hypothetical protein
MNIAKICAVNLLLLLLAAATAHPFAAMSAGEEFSGIASYAFEPNPQEITPKMYNWRVTLSKADSQRGAYEIVQFTRPKRANSKALEPAQNVLVESKMIAVNQDGVVDFNLYVGDRTPKANMGLHARAGEPIIFSGKGTGKGESNWIVLPGPKIDQAVPSTKGTSLADGRLRLIQFAVNDERGEPFQVDVVLTRK